MNNKREQTQRNSFVYVWSGLVTIFAGVWAPRLHVTHLGLVSRFIRSSEILTPSSIPSFLLPDSVTLVGASQRVAPYYVKPQFQSLFSELFEQNFL